MDHMLELMRQHRIGIITADGRVIGIEEEHLV